MGHFVDLKAADGFVFPAYVAKPSGQPKGGVVVLQEIFGVNAHIREVADGYAAQGYLAVAPSTFHRLKAGVELGYGPDDMTQGRDLKAMIATYVEVLGEAPAAYRFPFLAESPTLMKALDKLGITVMSVDAGAEDWLPDQTPQRLADKLMGQLAKPGGGIILLHDIHAHDAEAAAEAEASHPGGAPTDTDETDE